MFDIQPVPSEEGESSNGHVNSEYSLPSISTMNCDQHDSIEDETVENVIVEDKRGKKRALTDGQTSISKFVTQGFNQSDTMVALIEMIVIDKMSFSTVDKPGFKGFCSVAIPEFVIPSREIFVREFFKIYEAKKIVVRNELVMQRVSLTADTWTSVQGTNFMVLTAHFIDSEWKMHKKVLSACQIPNRQPMTIGTLIEKCLFDWKIKKILTITVDNAPANKTSLEWLNSMMNERLNCIRSVLEGKFLHVRCTVHIVKLIVGQVLKVFNKSVLAIRNAVSYVCSSSDRWLSFKDTLRRKRLSCSISIVLDVPESWNTTYLMLQSALTLRHAFDYLRRYDTEFQGYFDEEEDEDSNEHCEDVQDGVIAPIRKRKRVGPPEDLDWEKVKVLVDFLEFFYKITLKFSSSLKPMIHEIFHDMIVIERKLNSLDVPLLDPMQPHTYLQSVLSNLSVKLNMKYEKYFGRYKDMNELIFVALVLDPRFKMKGIAYLLKKEGFPDVEVKKRTDELACLMKKLYDCYKPVDNVGGSQSSNSNTGALIRVSRATDCGYDFLDDWMQLVGSDDFFKEHEVDRYLFDRVEKYNVGVELDILSWWKLNGPTYPVLAAMAKDILAIQVSSVASDNFFNTKRKVMDSSMSSLTPKSIEAMVCLQNWLKADDTVSFVKMNLALRSMGSMSAVNQQQELGVETPT